MDLWFVFLMDSGHFKAHLSPTSVSDATEPTAEEVNEPLGVPLALLRNRRSYSPMKGKV